MAGTSANRIVRGFLHELLKPPLEDLGFTGKYPEFRRDWEDEIHFVSIQTLKYGGGFAINGAWRKRVPYIENERAPVTADDTTLAHTNFDDRANIARMIPVGIVSDQRMAWRSAGDYDYSLLGGDEDACRSLVENAVSLLAALDHWLKTREPSLGVDTKGHRIRSAYSKKLLWRMATGQAGGFDLTRPYPVTPHMDAAELAAEAPEFYLD